jgi:hypothetical protein
LRWDALFADLEAQAAALERGAVSGEIEEHTRAEFGGISAADRVRAAIGQSVRVSCAGAVAVAGTLTRAGPGWLLLEEGGGRETLVLMDAVTAMRGLGRASTVPGSAGVVGSGLGVRHVLRGIARDRLPVRLVLRDGASLDATIDRVGADHVEVALHAPGEARRSSDVRRVEVILLAALATVRRAR